MLCTFPSKHSFHLVAVLPTRLGGVEPRSCASCPPDCDRLGEQMSMCYNSRAKMAKTDYCFRFLVGWTGACWMSFVWRRSAVSGGNLWRFET